MLLAAALLALAPVQDAELVTETLPDGTYVEREVVRRRDGTVVSHGSYKSWWDDTQQAQRATAQGHDGADGIRRAQSRRRVLHGSRAGAASSPLQFNSSDCSPGRGPACNASAYTRPHAACARSNQ